ncbi:MAG: NUDIX hydrolase [Labilithrix sp.]|nr:NUDIX hydrolase [Labilithrix sp.]MBX3224602.1 NUDIX hydrolase [Labilithrix sp.]
MPFSYAYPRPAVTCDVVVFTMRADDLAVLLIQRKDEPFRGRWALPGGYVNENESLERAAARELAEETGIGGARLEQLGAFGDPGRDPRGHTITIAFTTFLVAEAKIKAGDDAAAAAWHSFRSLALDGAPSARAATARSTPDARRGAQARPSAARSRTGGRIQLAFDHAILVARAYRRLCGHLDDPVRDRTFNLLPSRFTLADVQHVYEVVLGHSLSQRTFRKRLLEQNLVVPAAAAPTKKPAAQLYRWNRPR